MPRFALAALAVSALLAAAAPVRAESVIVDSLELRVAQAERVVVGTVVQSQVLPYRSGGGWRWTLARLAVEETLRGPKTREIDVLVRGGMIAGPWSAPGSRILALLLPRDPAATASDSPPDSAPDGAWIAAPGSSSITDPGLGAIVLDPKAPPIVTRDFRVLRDPSALLTAARAAAKAAGPGPVEAYPLDTPFDSEAGKLLYAGSVVSVRVPIDAALIAQARAWVRSSEVSERVRGAEILGKVPGKDVDALLKGLLDDPGAWLQSWDDGRRERLYPVRRAARDALRDRGVAVGEVVITEPLPPEKPSR